MNTALFPESRNGQAPRTRARWSPALLVTALIAAALSLGHTSTATAASSIDPAVRAGTLSNGLKYFIRRNASTSPAVDFRLVVNVGSAHERKDQSGHAHFLEHMLFNGTKKYPGDALTKAIDATGGQWNGGTSYDTTIYELTIPRPKPETLATGVTVLREWLSEASLTDKDTIEERGVIVEERRARGNEANRRITLQALDLWFAGSSYDNHLVIGDLASITSMTGADAREFYTTWYRPDNAAVVVVGDLDVDAMEKLVKEKFSSAMNPKNKLNRSPLRAAKNSKAMVKVTSAKDIDATQTSVAFVRESPAVGPQTSRQDDILLVLTQLLNNRFVAKLSSGAQPYRTANVSITSRVFEGVDLFGVDLTGDAKQAGDAATSVLRELNTIARDGVPAAEFDTALKEIRALIKSIIDQRDSLPNGLFVKLIVDHYRFGTSLASLDDEVKRSNAELAKLQPKEVQSALATWLKETPKVSIAGPAKDAAVLPREADLLKTVEGLANEKPKATETATPGAKSADAKPASKPAPPQVGATTEIMPVKPNEVKEISRSSLTAAKAFKSTSTVLSFANGARVIVTPTQQEKGKVALIGMRQGAALDVAQADILNFQAMASVAAESGAGGKTKAQLDSMKATAATSISFGVSRLDSIIDASTTKANLEAMAQLVHVGIRKPQFEKNALDRFLASIRPIVEDPLTEPNFALTTALAKARFGNDIRFGALPPKEDLDTLSGERMKKTWAAEFGNASGWVYSLTGDFTAAEGERIARTYFGTLPGTKRSATAVAYPTRPDKVVTETIKTGTGDKGVIATTFSETVANDEQMRLNSLILEKVLYQRLFEAIREQAGATYTPDVSVARMRFPVVEVETSIRISGDPKKADAIAKIVQGEVRKLTTTPVSANEFARALEQVRTIEGTNSVVDVGLIALGDVFDETRDLTDAFNRWPERLAKITPESFRLFAGRVLPSGRYIQVTAAP
jgi:zinc protease